MYPLQTLFEIRERAKKDAEDAYAKEKHILNEAEQKLRDMQAELKQMQDDRIARRNAYFEQMNSGKLTIEEIQMGQRHLEKMFQQELAFKEKIKHQEEIVKEAQKRVDKALEKLNHATQEYKVLEKHKEKWAKARKKELEKKEEETADDLTQARFAMHMKELEDG
jgi:flagellar export protein FliJ